MWILSVYFVKKVCTGTFLYASAFFFLAIITLWTTKKMQSIAAIVIPVHHAWSSPADDTIFWIVLSDRTPKKVPIIFPTPPVSSVPPIMEEAIAFISISFAITESLMEDRRLTLISPTTATHSPSSTKEKNLMNAGFKPFNLDELALIPIARIASSEP